MTDFFSNQTFQKFIVSCLDCETAEEFEKKVINPQEHYGIDERWKVQGPIIFKNIEAVIDHIEHIEPINTYEPIKTYNYKDLYWGIDKEQEAVDNVYNNYIVTREYIDPTKPLGEYYIPGYKPKHGLKNQVELNAAKDYKLENFIIDLQTQFYGAYAKSDIPDDQMGTDHAKQSIKFFESASKKYKTAFDNLIKNINGADNTIIDKSVRLTHIIEHLKLKEYYNSSHLYNGVPPVEKSQDFDLQLKQCLVSNKDHHGKLFLYKGGEGYNDICIAMATMWNPDPQLQGETYNRNRAVMEFSGKDIEYGIKKYKDYRLTYELSIYQAEIKDIWASKYVNRYNINGTSKQTISYVCENISETLRDIQRSGRVPDHKYKTTQAYNNYIKRLLGEPIKGLDIPSDFINNHHKKHALVIPPTPGEAAAKAAAKAKVKAEYEILRPTRELEEKKKAEEAQKKYKEENPEALKTPKHMKEGLKRIEEEAKLDRKKRIREESPKEKKERIERERKEKKERIAAKKEAKEKEKAAKAKEKEERIAAKKKKKEEAKAKPGVGTSFLGQEVPIVVPAPEKEEEGAYLDVVPAPEEEGAYLDVVPAQLEKSPYLEVGPSRNAASYMNVEPAKEPAYLEVGPSGKAAAAAADAEIEKDVLPWGFEPEYVSAEAPSAPHKCKDLTSDKCMMPKFFKSCKTECDILQSDLKEFGFAGGGSRKHKRKSKGSKRHFLKKSVSKKHFLGKNTFRKSVGKKRKSVSKKKKRHFLGKNTFRKSVGKKGKSVSKKTRKNKKSHFLKKNTFRKSVGKKHFLGKSVSKKKRRHFLGKSVSKKGKSVSKKKKRVSKKH
jgi:hypothetical protein